MYSLNAILKAVDNRAEHYRTVHARDFRVRMAAGRHDRVVLRHPVPKVHRHAAVDLLHHLLGFGRVEKIPPMVPRDRPERLRRVHGETVAFRVAGVHGRHVVGPAQFGQQPRPQVRTVFHPVLAVPTVPAKNVN